MTKQPVTLTEEIEKLEACPCGCLTHKRMLRKSKILELVKSYQEAEDAQLVRRLVEILHSSEPEADLGKFIVELEGKREGEE